ncbi:hypothetical protein FKM82_024322 [Ascaphus truei]
MGCSVHGNPRDTNQSEILPSKNGSDQLLLFIFLIYITFFLNFIARCELQPHDCTLVYLKNKFWLVKITK